MYGGSANHAANPSGHYSNLVDEMNNMHLSQGSKVAPTVPPKPRRPQDVNITIKLLANCCYL